MYYDFEEQNAIKEKQCDTTYIAELKAKMEKDLARLFPHFTKERIERIIYDYTNGELHWYATDYEGEINPYFDYNGWISMLEDRKELGEEEDI